MKHSTLPAFTGRLFTPLWLSQSLSAMNDNIFRQGAISLLAFSALKSGALLASLSTALFVMPFFLFSATAGAMADRYPKALVMRYLRAAEILVFAFVAYALHSNNHLLIGICLFLGGTMATLYGPLKIAVLPELLPPPKLLGANGLVEAGLFLAILCGTMIGSGATTHFEWIIVVLLASTILAFIFSLLVPNRPAAAPMARLDWNIIRTTKQVLRDNLRNRDLRHILLGISWFWFVGATFLTQFAHFVAADLKAAPTVSTLCLGLFSIGIALGSLTCHKLLRGEVSAKFVPLAALLMTLFTIDLYFSSTHFTATVIHDQPLTLRQFLDVQAAWRIVFDLVMIAFAAGLYIVPLTTMMQTYAAPENRARVVAAGNILDAILMTLSSLLGAALIKFDFSASAIFLAVGLLTAGVAFYTYRVLQPSVTADDKSLFSALNEARHLHGGQTKIMEDVARQPVTYDRLLLGSLALGRMLARQTSRNEIVGLLLPNSIATSMTFWGLQSRARVPALLNFTAGIQNMRHALHTANIKLIVTSKQFISKGKFEPLIMQLSEHCRIVYLEDLQKNMPASDKACAWLQLKLNMILGHNKPDDTAVVLFTSGSEGVPKAVALSHNNIIANFKQIRAVVDFTSRDTLFNVLPVFHSFGLCVGTILPVLAGVPSFQYPSPLNYRAIVELVHDTGATIFFGTDTFLAGYAKIAAHDDFKTLRYVFAGAEKLRDDTRRIWQEKFGINIFEGYGITETSPVLAINTAQHNKPGTVGRLLPDIEHRLEPVPGIDEGGRLLVRGPNVMRGYLSADGSGEIITLQESGNWYDTGDIVTIDDGGFVHIKGRAKRFAKIAGEMISLHAVETTITHAFPDFQHAVLAVPDDRKGEALILITTRPDTTKEEILTALRASGAGEIMVPKQNIYRAELPLLGSGKIDYSALKDLINRHN